MHIHLDFKDYISLIAITISIISFAITIYERKIKLSADLNGIGDENYIDIYNLTSKKVTISYFELYHSKFKYFSKRTLVNTWYDDGEIRKYVISPYESVSIAFKEQYKINNFIAGACNQNIYIKVLVYGKKNKIIRLR